MHVLALRADLRFPESRSLKQKRSLLRPITDGLRVRFPVAVAETAHQDSWQRAEIGVAIVAGEAGHVEDVAQAVDRFIWAAVGCDVLAIERTWLEEP